MDKKEILNELESHYKNAMTKMLEETNDLVKQENLGFMQGLKCAIILLKA